MEDEIIPASRQFTEPTFWEWRRHELACQGRIAEFQATYQLQTCFFPDMNTPHFWDTQFAHSQPTISAFELWRFRTVAQYLAHHEQKLPLANLGIGRAAFEEYLDSQNMLPAEYIGVDMTRSTLKKVAQKFPQMRLEQSASLTELPFSDQSLSGCILMEVLEHITPQKSAAVLGELHRVLRDTGKLIVSVPLNEGLSEMLPNNPNSHMRMYSVPVVLLELECAGFAVQSYHTASAFSTHFELKNWLNTFLSVRLPNDVVVVCQKK